MKPSRLGDRTIRDFGEQWTRYGDLSGYLGSAQLLSDTLSPLFALDDVAGRRVADIGSGAGRVVRVLARAGAAHVVAVEPSDAFAVLQANTREESGRITYLRCRGDELPATGDCDTVFALGVLHHIPDPAPVVRAALGALKPGGRFIAWLYAREGTRLYRAVTAPLRAVTRRLPHPLLAALVRVLDVPLALYVRACEAAPLPLSEYVRRVLVPLGPERRRLTIYDQLNPAYTRHYSREEAVALLQAGGFENVRAHHQHGYSWLVVGTRP
jgi:SAM-dependent methyltransferase